jgi:RNA polymerase sigma-70 factor (ECF subfamily)
MTGLDREGDSMKANAPPVGGADDYALMDAIVERDSEALSTLYDRYAPKLLAVCTRVLRERGAAEELLVEIFQEVWDHARRYDATRGCPGAYLATLARSRSIDRLRRRPVATTGGVGASRGAGPLGAAGDPADASAGPLDLVLLDEQGRAVRAAMARLDPLQRDAIECAFYDGLSHAEVAERLGKPLGTVKSGIRRGLLRLRDLLVSERASVADEPSAGEVAS